MLYNFFHIWHWQLVVSVVICNGQRRIFLLSLMVGQLLKAALRSDNSQHLTQKPLWRAGGGHFGYDAHSYKTISKCTVLTTPCSAQIAWDQSLKSQTQSGGELYPVKVVERGSELVHLLLTDAFGISGQDLGLNLVDGSSDGCEEQLPSNANVLLMWRQNRHGHSEAWSFSGTK